MRDPAVYVVDDQEDGHREVPNVLAHGPGEGSCEVCLWSKHCGGTLIVRSAVQHSMLHSYASPECVAFPQITQIAAWSTFGTRRILRTCTFGVVATDTKRAVLQQLQGHITTLLKSLAGSDKVLLFRQSKENITILSFLFEQH
jgi:hypothetical protein